MFQWISRNTDLMALALAVLGMAISLLTVALSIHQARLNAYTRMHELLISPDVARGRRLLFQASAADAFPGLGETGWDEINRSLAMYDTLGVYVRRGIVSRRVVLEAWHHPLSDIGGPTRAFLEHRRRGRIQNPWPSLGRLLDAAARYRSRQGCCSDVAGPDSGRFGR